MAENSRPEGSRNPKSWCKQEIRNEAGKFTIRLEWEGKQKIFMDLDEHLRFDQGSSLDQALGERERESNRPPQGP